MASLEEIRAKLQSQENKFEGRGTSSGDRASYPFWNVPEGQSASLRFLPDADPNNTFFWAERLVIRLPFNGIVGQHNKEVTVTVPCLEMYGESCPIISEIRPWWSDSPEMQTMARKYYKKKSYLFQGFVVNSPIEEQEKPENPIRRFVINQSIYDIIKSSLMNPDMENSPTDYVGGRDFKLTKTQKGQYANYSTSTWSFKTRDLNDEELAAIDKYGLFELKSFLPKKPNDEEREAIFEMFKASVNEEAYDPAKWSKYYKPFGVGNDSSGDSETTVASRASVTSSTASDIMSRLAVKKSEPEVVEDEEPVVESKSTAKADASEILKRLKERQGAK